MKTILLNFLFLSLSIGSHASDEVTGTVINVIDGNTIEVAGDDQETHTVLLVGIDCPELGQEFGDLAKKFLEKKILQKKVTIIFQGKDRRGNRLALITHKEDDVRLELLKEGFAWTVEKDPDAALEALRIKAQEKKKGLWNDDNPVPPWTYRRQQTMLQPKSS